jgi:hypothetical protein
MSSRKSSNNHVENVLNQNSVSVAMNKISELKQSVSEIRSSLEQLRTKEDEFIDEELKNKTWFELVNIHIKCRLRVDDLQEELKDLRRLEKKKSNSNLLNLVTPQKLSEQPNCDLKNELNINEFDEEGEVNNNNNNSNSNNNNESIDITEEEVIYINIV